MTINTNDVITNGASFCSPPPKTENADEENDSTSDDCPNVTSANGVNNSSDDASILIATVKDAKVTLDTKKDATTNNTQLNRSCLGKPPLLTALTKTTMPEDALQDALTSLTINSQSSILSPSSIRSDFSTSLEDPHNNREAQTMAHNFATEHRIFLRAALDMLTERDQLRMYADVNDPNNVIKSGTLRKASHRIKGVWKLKHVEVREGVFSYFRCNRNTANNNDHHHITTMMATNYTTGSRSSSCSSQSSNKSSRKDVLLRATSCTCRALKIRSVKLRPTNFGNGAVFELKVDGGSRRLWMANTREERQSWMQAIHAAMIGASVTRSDNFLQFCIDKNNNNNNDKRKGSIIPLNSPYQPYLEQYIEIGEACSRARNKAEYLHALASLRGKPISVPVQWIKSQLDDTPAASAFLESDISSSVEQLWKDLVRDSVEINGQVLTGESFHGPDRIVGKLTQQILLSGRSQNLEVAHNRITESQSVLYARNILLGSHRTRTGGDSYYCAENLCTNQSLVVICPSSTEANPLSISVHASRDEEENKCNKGDIRHRPRNELRGTVSTRSNVGEPWKKMHMALSGNMLQFYDDNDKTKLVNEINLIGAKVSDTVLSDDPQTTTGRFIAVSTGDENYPAQEFLFEDDFDYFLWWSSIGKASVGDDCGSFNSSSLLDETRLDNNSTLHVASTVIVSVNVSTNYKVCTLDPQGEESEDTWATIRTTFKQQFQLSGGPSGRIFRGDEIVQLELL